MSPGLTPFLEVGSYAKILSPNSKAHQPKYFVEQAPSPAKYTLTLPSPSRERENKGSSHKKFDF
jgi:hypothetical protein